MHWHPLIMSVRELNVELLRLIYSLLLSAVISLLRLPSGGQLVGNLLDRPRLPPARRYPLKVFVR